MLVAERFTSLGRGNGFPFCVIHATDADINSLNGHQDKSINPISGAETVTEIYGVTEVTLTEAMNFIWNLHSVSFPSVNVDGESSNPQTFDNPAILQYDSTVQGYTNSIEYTPVQRACKETLGLPVPRATNPPRNDEPGGWFVAQTIKNSNDFSAQFAIRSIYYATDTNKYYIGFTSSVRSDDDSFKQEIPFANLIFDYYTYS
jgi:hypothetical protein